MKPYDTPFDNPIGTFVSHVAAFLHNCQATIIRLASLLDPFSTKDSYKKVEQIDNHCSKLRAVFVAQSRY